MRMFATITSVLLLLGIWGVGCAQEREADLPTAIVLPINASEMAVPTTIPFDKQMDRHMANLRRLQTLSWGLKRGARNAVTAGDKVLQVRVAEGQRATWHFLAPYAIAAGQRDALEQGGYQLVDSNKVCDARKQCGSLDASTALMMIISGSAKDEVVRRALERAPKVKEGLAGSRSFASRPKAGETSGLYEVLGAMLAEVDGRQMSDLLRNPAVAPQEIIASWKHQVATKNIGPIAAAIRSPARCTNGEVFKDCDE